ncbi:hypothetical protein ACROYT_G013907 [Oculina patagonica]
MASKLPSITKKAIANKSNYGSGDATRPVDEISTPISQSRKEELQPTIESNPQRALVTNTRKCQECAEVDIPELRFQIAFEILNQKMMQDGGHINRIWPMFEANIPSNCGGDRILLSKDEVTGSSNLTRL